MSAAPGLGCQLSVPNLVPPKGSASRKSLPARDTSSFLCRTTVIDKVLGFQGNGLQVLTPTVACAGSGPLCLRRKLQPLKGCSSNCAAAPVAASSGCRCFGVGPSFKAEQEFRGWQGPSAMHIPTSVSFGVCRITNRCSGPGHIKCSAAGGRAVSSTHRFRARVLTSQRAAAELSRYTTAASHKQQSV